MNIAGLAEKLVSWIKEQVSLSGCRGVVLGMSGGIDSSVLAVLCKQAFPESTLGLILPCHSLEEDMEHGRMVADQFSIPTRLVDLTPLYDILLKSLPDTGSPLTRRGAEGNLKARLRMLTLYYFANRLGYLVAGSSNRDELAVGYFTKYGDGGVDMMPLGNLVKAEVRGLACFLGIPRAIVQKPPSAGLWPGQTDEGDMGITYEELDCYLLAGEAPPPVRARIERMVAVSAHKRQLPPIPTFRLRGET